MPSQPQFPPIATIYDYYVDAKKLDWELWEPKVAPFLYIKTMPFHKMIVPTVDTVGVEQERKSSGFVTLKASCIILDYVLFSIMHYLGLCIT